MNVLLIGQGGREHALAWALTRSPRLGALFCAPGNPGIAALAACVALDPGDHAAVAAFCRRESVGLVVIGPEAPLVAGLADDLRAAGIAVFGPGREAARLEGSKGFTKDLCARHAIPTAAYARFTDARAAKAYLNSQGAPIVVKADGLAAGKGVTVAETVAEAEAAVDACFSGAFGAAGAELVIEERLVGTEASLFALVDGETALALAGAQDHKRALDGDRGPNTGGMGAFSPSIALTPEIEARAMREIVEPTVAALKAEGAPFRGVLYAGLMLTDEGPKLIEYNVRFGDPETQAIALRLDEDLLDLMLAVAEGRLAGRARPRLKADAALTVVLAAEGYPGPVAKGARIGGLEAAGAVEGVEVFHAGTRAGADGALLADGGRVLNIAASGRDLEQARERAYRALARIDWPGAAYRGDIGLAAAPPAAAVSVQAQSSAAPTGYPGETPRERRLWIWGALAVGALLAYGAWRQFEGLFLE